MSVDSTKGTTAVFTDVVSNSVIASLYCKEAKLFEVFKKNKWIKDV